MLNYLEKAMPAIRKREYFRARHVTGVYPYRGPNLSYAIRSYGVCVILFDGEHWTYTTERYSTTTNRHIKEIVNILKEEGFEVTQLDKNNFDTRLERFRVEKRAG